jgi:hypothetical protein
MKTLKEVRQDHIRTVLEENGWDIKKASDVLQIPERQLLTEARRLAKPPGTSGAREGHSRGSKGKEE